MSSAPLPTDPLVVEPDEIRTVFPSLGEETIVRVPLGETDVHFSVSRHPSRRVVFMFHGALKRATRPIPYFEGLGLARALRANIVGVADPSLHVSDGLAAAWYAGHDGFESQRLLPNLFARIARALGSTRPVFLGGSSGGFAALFYAWHLEDSVAVVMNPQTSLERHEGRGIAKYRGTCWPKHPRSVPMSSFIVSDLAALYRERVPSSVVYLQNSTDHRHLREHFAPFLAALPHEALERVVVQVGFWGRVGHSGSIPGFAWKQWTRAALTAETHSAMDIMAAHDALASPAPSAPSIELGDIATAARLAEWSREQLRRDRG